MKKLFILVAVVGFAASFTSCKKDYVCECTVAGTSLSYEILDAKSSDAEDACSATETTYKSADPEATCTLN